MDITPGMFKDFSKTKQASKHNSSRPNSSFTTSLELLSPEPINKSRPSSVGTSVSLKSSKIDDVASRLHSSRASFSKGFCDDEVLSKDEEKMRKAVLKMNKLDEILAEKLSQEKQIKLQRLRAARKLHVEMLQLSKEKETSSYSDAISNTAKYLALLPPLEQLEVLIEKCESTEDFVEPIFQTQYFENLDANYSQRGKGSLVNKSAERNNPPTSSSSSRASKESGKRKKKNAQPNENEPENHNETKEDSLKRNFIKRNIELVKDSGQLILMTPEEKARLSELLKDLDENVSLDEKNENKNVNTVVVIEDGMGYQPEKFHIDRLNQIDEKLLSISNISHSNSSCNLKLPSTINYEGYDATLPTSVKSNLVETFNACDKFQQIEERLNKLDQEWKEKFDNNKEPRLDEDTLNHLLSQFAPLSSRSTVVTTDGDDTISQQILGDDATTTYTDDVVSLYSQQTTSSSSVNLSREQLDKLLIDARTCLGLTPANTHEETDDDIGGVELTA